MGTVKTTRDALLTALAALATLLAPAVSPTWAGPPPASCRPEANNGCDLASDRLVFAQGDAEFQIEMVIEDCTLCSQGGSRPDAIRFDGTGRVTFGPYESGRCPGDYSDTPIFSLAGFEIVEGAVVLGEQSYVPSIPAQEIQPDDLDTPLDTFCVGAQYLRTEIPDFTLSGNDGARSLPNDGLSDNASAWFPDPVIARDGGAFIRWLDLDSFRFSQRLDFVATRSEPSSTTIAIQPEGLPFELVPSTMTFTARDVGFETWEYRARPPVTSSASSLQAAQIMACTAPDPAFPCTTPIVANDGFLYNDDWSATNARYGVSGLSVELAYAASPIVYEMLFPKSMHVRLEAPGSITVDLNAITAGQFAGGSIFLGTVRDKCTSNARRMFTADGLIRVGPGGSLTTAIADLNREDFTTTSTPMTWSYNEAEGLGCGTFYAPPAFTAATPHRVWYASAVPTVLGRGIYAGINYNRTRACVTSDGSLTQKLCVSDAECEIGAGEACRDAGHAPYCGPLTSTPIWRTTIEGDNTFGYPIIPDNPAVADREMVFVMRSSGVTGVFDAGDGDFSFGDPQSGTFAFTIDRLGTAFKRSRSESGDTITAGQVDIPWPADTSVPFDQMRLCDCGAMGGGKTPDVLFERSLGYWNQTYFPTGLSFFAPDPADPDAADCSQVQNFACSTETASTRVCVDAVMPVRRFEPDIIGAFDMTPQGQVGDMAATADPRLDFDRNKAAGALDAWSVDVENISFSDWALAGSPTKSEVTTIPANPLLDPEPFGWLDLQGEIALPFFGLAENALKINYDLRRSDFLADAHTRCDTATSPNCAATVPSRFTASRTMAGATVPLPFLVDYVSSGETADPDDGNGRAGEGTGWFFAHASEPAFDLGSVAIAASILMRHDQGVVGGDADLGASAVPRLWANLTGSRARKTDILETIVPAGRLTAASLDRYDQVIAKLGYSGQGHLLPPPATFSDLLFDGEAIDLLVTPAEDDADLVYNMEGDTPEASPPVNGDRAAGWLDISPDFSRADVALVGADMDTGGEFFAFDASWLKVERHVKDGGEEPITSMTRRGRSGAGKSMQLQGEQDIAFPKSTTQNKNGEDNSPLTWDIDFGPNFQFRSMTGTLDLTKSGLSSVGFDKLGATMKFYADGDWYFTAGMKGKFNSVSMNADFLTGNTTSMAPLYEIDPDVARFLKGVEKFDGVYIGGGFSAPIFDYGCFFRVSAGVQVAGWYLSEAYGAKVRGWISGTGACVVSVRGDLTLIGGVNNDIFKISGKFWVGGGIGFCSPEDWDSPAEALDDDFCAVCVATLKASGTYPPEDLNLQVDEPDFDCTL